MKQEEHFVHLSYKKCSQKWKVVICTSQEGSH
jgi:hypothetical protein